LKTLHFIAIGGAAMHNLAIALLNLGYQITGSDDEIFEPSLSRLKSCNLLPEKQGWFPEKLNHTIDAVILGMHARPDNPELRKAKELGLKIFSYPEFLYEQTKNKKRVVIAGSHGKTTTTAIIIHVLNYHKWKIDFMVGSQIEGFENMVALTEDSEIAIFEGDEYLSSPIDLRPKFFHYKPHITLISGIAWDHINVFPTFNDYLEQFKLLTEMTEDGGHLVYYSGDTNLNEISKTVRSKVRKHPYIEHPSKTINQVTYLLTGKEEVPIKIFGKHNLQNINGAKKICNLLGLPDEDFYKAITSFPGTSKRLQELANKGSFTCFLDFAHAPSKVKATLQAVREQFPSRRLMAVLELHTFSSLNKEFIPQYAGTLDLADEAVVFFNKHVLEYKKMEDLPEDYVRNCFKKVNLKVLTSAEKLTKYLTEIKTDNSVLLLMSSGNFGGIKIKEIIQVS
jgi:UDP-N-acetylmuramate: L-alanyl-gamma-D-glutamyl-meso-diaminopimelate ligase